MQISLASVHSMTIQCMRLTDHVTLNFKNKMSLAVVFVDIEKAFDTTWQPGFLCNLHNLKCSLRLIKLISSFLSQ
jgi:hypothetical protein